jgi:hypothetical protein
MNETSCPEPIPIPSLHWEKCWGFSRFELCSLFALEDGLRWNIAPDRRASSLSSTSQVQRFLMLFRWIFDNNTLDTNARCLKGVCNGI